MKDLNLIESHIVEITSEIGTINKLTLYHKVLSLIGVEYNESFVTVRREFDQAISGLRRIQLIKTRPTEHQVPFRYMPDCYMNQEVVPLY